MNQPTAQQLEQLQKALLDAFDHSALARLSTALDTNLQHITPVHGDPNLTNVVFHMVYHFASQDEGLKNLLAAAHRANPNNAFLYSLTEQWAAQDFAPIPPTSHQPPITSNQPPLQRPPQVEHFQDRKAELAQLLDALNPGQVATLCGPGGMGKTALASKAIWHLAPENEPPAHFPDGILFHSFYNQPSADAALEHIARSYGLELDGPAQAAARRALSGRTALLVLDGTEEADDLPRVLNIRNRCGVLVTSRKASDAPSDRQDLHPLPAEDAQLLLNEWAGSKIEEPTAKRITELVGHLPLAVRLAGRYLSQRVMTSQDYCHWLEASPLNALAQGERRLESVPLLLSRSLEQVSEAAKQALAVSGWLALNPFPVEAFAAALAVDDRFAAFNLLGELMAYGLVVPTIEGYVLSHALIHTYAREELALAGDAQERLVTWLTDQVDQNNRNFPHLDRLRPHAVALQQRSAEASMWSEVERLADVVDEYLRLQGHWADRLTMCQTALDAAQVEGKTQPEARWLNNMGLVYSSLGEKQKALDFYNQSLPLYLEVGDKGGEATTLTNIGAVYDDLGEKQKALDFYNQSLPLYLEVGDKGGEATTLNNMGRVYDALGEKQKALDYYNQSLPLYLEVGDKGGEARTLNNMGGVYSDLGEKQKALDYYNQSLPLRIEVGDKGGQAVTLNNMGRVYDALGEKQKALDFYNQSLPLLIEVGDKGGQAVTLNNMGRVYDALGEKQKALDYYNQSLPLRIEVGDKGGEATTLNNMGRVYDALGEKQKALDFYNQSLPLTIEVGDKGGEARTLNNMGLVYSSLGEKQKALDYYNQSLPLYLEVGDRFGQSITLLNMGATLAELGELEQAEELLLQTVGLMELLGIPHLDAARSWLERVQNERSQVG